MKQRNAVASGHENHRPTPAGRVSRAFQVIREASRVEAGGEMSSTVPAPRVTWGNNQARAGRQLGLFAMFLSRKYSSFPCCERTPPGRRRCPIREPPAVASQRRGRDLSAPRGPPGARWSPRGGLGCELGVCCGPSWEVPALWCDVSPGSLETAELTRPAQPSQCRCHRLARDDSGRGRLPPRKRGGLPSRSLRHRTRLGRLGAGGPMPHGHGSVPGLAERERKALVEGA